MRGGQSLGAGSPLLEGRLAAGDSRTAPSRSRAFALSGRERERGPAQRRWLSSLGPRLGALPGCETRRNFSNWVGGTRAARVVVEGRPSTVEGPRSMVDEARHEGRSKTTVQLLNTPMSPALPAVSAMPAVPAVSACSFFVLPSSLVEARVQRGEERLGVRWLESQRAERAG